MCPLFETILIENRNPCHLYWHQQRVGRSFRQMGFAAQPPDLEKILRVPDWLEPEKKYRLRINYDQSAYELIFTEYQPKPVQTLKLVHNSHISYDLKYTDRISLDALVQMKENADDVLIVKNGLITDTSIANIIFWDEKNWVTPSRPLLEGTTRARLIATGQILEKPVSVDRLHGFSGWNVINVLRPFDPVCIFPMSSIFK